MRLRRCLALLATAALLAGGLTGCRSNADLVIALMLPDSGATRWTERDQVVFEQVVEARCPRCRVEVSMAEADPNLQERQLAQALDAGADAIVLAAVSSEAGESLLQSAGAVPVIAYDRFIAGADYYVSFDNAAVGRLQAEALVAATPAHPRLLVLNGAQGDPNATAMEIAAGKVFNAAGARVLATERPEDWHTDTAQKWVTAQIERLGDNPIDGVYAGNDAQASGVIQALKATGHQLVPVTGQDGEIGALQRIVTGEQTMTVYKSVTDEATSAAELAVHLVLGQEVEDTTQVEGVPSYLFEPVAVTVANLADTAVRDGAVTIDELCAPPGVRRACERQGIA
jgi:D-xylose transport system substrate-binding protein